MRRMKKKSLEKLICALMAFMIVVATITSPVISLAVGMERSSAAVESQEEKTAEEGKGPIGCRQGKTERNDYEWKHTNWVKWKQSLRI